VEQEAKLLASDGEMSDQFGWSVAISGDTAVVGAFADDQAAGSAYVFVRSGTVWTEQAKLTVSDASSDDRFGWSVALDGDTAGIGAYYDGDNGEWSGSAYVFRLYDDDVPATGAIGLALLLMAVLGTGFYFMRRRVTG
jgi:hypothetical protein